MWRASTTTFATLQRICHSSLLHHAISFKACREENMSPERSEEPTPAPLTRRLSLPHSLCVSGNSLPSVRIMGGVSHAVSASAEGALRARDRTNDSAMVAHPTVAPLSEATLQARAPCLLLFFLVALRSIPMC
jgi:hypothetical protein